MPHHQLRICPNRFWERKAIIWPKNLIQSFCKPSISIKPSGEDQDAGSDRGQEVGKEGGWRVEEGEEVGQILEWAK